ncbi:hypothetical protein CDAR_274351 [Caerostris darwini]|uniref:Uncharacterized protein n=1 Tax=Caerostris darwini TaxID=1538125 RepID=A0AAV4RH35_9ARAC|nr:hypothetical protein CDAR_274351 [Caerostris darwini]
MTTTSTDTHLSRRLPKLTNTEFLPWVGHPRCVLPSSAEVLRMATPVGRAHPKRLYWGKGVKRERQQQGRDLPCHVQTNRFPSPPGQHLCSRCDRVGGHNRLEDGKW